MREYLKAIGFSDLNSRKKIDELINEIKKNPSRKNWFQIDEEEAIFIYEKDFAEAVGIAVIEVMDRDGYQVTDHFYPYVRGANYLYHEDLEFEHYTDKEGYAGICDENNIGIPLIFHVNNPVDYLKIVYGKFHDKINSITLSGMSKKGMIILPVEKDEFQEREERKGNELRNEMIDAAKAGDIEAMEQLTLEDMDTYTAVSSRSKKEDLFTIVTSYFMPHSVECDKYSVLGKIINVMEMQNSRTKEIFYYLSVECNSIQIEFTIAKEDLMVGIAGAAWIGSALILMLIAAVSRRIKDIMVILILGMMFSSGVGAVVQILQYLSNEAALKSFVVWTMGSLGDVTLGQLGLLLPAVVLGLVLAVAVIKPLNLLLLGENYARTMGLDIRRSRQLIFLSTTLLAGTVTAFCGPIGFIGLAVPHVARILFADADHRILVPASILTGIVVMLLCDVLAKLLTFPINTITALLGIPIVIWVVIRNKSIV